MGARCLRLGVQADGGGVVTLPIPLHAGLSRIGASWGQHWIRGGYAGTRELTAAIDPALRPAAADDSALYALAEVEAIQRRDASEHEREWQQCAEELCALRGAMLSAATVDERVSVANRLAQVVQRMVCWAEPECEERDAEGAL